MGIRGLTKYVDKIKNVWTPIELQDTKLVIDGSSLYYYLYQSNKFDCRCGGQYEEFYNAVLLFFEALHSKGVDSFVVLDGAQDTSGKKLDTHKARAENRIKASIELANSPESTRFMLPLLSKLVFIQALRKLRERRIIKYAVCDSEADAEITSLANVWNCPVLGDDSDFFIFDIKAGYIPFYWKVEGKGIESCFHWNSNKVKAQIFHRSKLASHLGIKAELLPLIASLAGNDYVSDDLLKPFFRSHPHISHLSMRREDRFEKIASLLPDCDVEKAVEYFFEKTSGFDRDCQLRQAVDHSLQEYTKYTDTESYLSPYLDKCNDDDFFCGVVLSSLRTRNKREVDQWVLRGFREGQFSSDCMNTLITGKNFLKLQVENWQEVSANHCSQSLRQFVYGILNDAAADDDEKNITTVEEWDRNKPSNVQPYKEATVPSMSLIPLLPKEERLLLFLNALNSNTDYIKSLPEKFILIAASLLFLVKNAKTKIETNHLTALFCSCVTLNDGSEKRDMENPFSQPEEDSVERRGESAAIRKPSSQPFDLRAAQSFAQWQCVLRDANHLNVVLLEPVETPCIHKTFNGRLAHYLQSELDRGRKPEELFSSPSSQLLYNKLCNALRNDREEEDEITAGIQKLNLPASPGQSENLDELEFGPSAHSSYGQRNPSDEESWADDSIVDYSQPLHFSTQENARERKVRKQREERLRQVPSPSSSHVPRSKKNAKN